MNASQYFSKQSLAYARYRPQYPGTLFHYLNSRSNENELAWDCATGSGQVAVGLAPYFHRVLASDVSEAQIACARTIENVEYSVASAENSGLASASVDLITVGQALHWFDVDTFYTEARRVLKPGGLLAVFSYSLPRLSPEIDKIIDTFHFQVLAEYWPAERVHVDNAYADLSFPLDRLPAPEMTLQHHWKLDEFLGYLSSWSAVAIYREKQLQDPLGPLREELEKYWPDSELVSIHWPLLFRAGRFA